MNKLKLFEHTYTKLCNDRAFMAFYLNEVAIKENRTLDEMTNLLNCSLETYYKLALCKAPEINEEFDVRIQKIAAYTNTQAVILGNIIKYASAQQTTKSALPAPAFLNKLTTLIILPEWLVRSQARIYQASISICIMALIIFSYASQKSKVKNSQLYINDYFSYTDSIKYTQARDNTYVYNKNL